ncbi:MAG: hypothetical protein IT372_16840 [Polyangiaceae bacterium]|nr:hypothetical protein [Polyangiaceae bacterium]
MARKPSLPLLHLDRALAIPTKIEQKPTIDAVRKRLGGRASTEAGAGELVTLVTPGGEHQGVILCVRGDDLDVWIDQAAALAAGPRAGVVRRARRADVAPPRPSASTALDAVAAGARVFADLLEGQRVRFQAEEGPGDGTLVEKCRFGALVLRDDGAVVGVGFRRIWPAEPGGAA